MEGSVYLKCGGFLFFSVLWRQIEESYVICLEIYRGDWLSRNIRLIDHPTLNVKHSDGLFWRIQKRERSGGVTSDFEETIITSDSRRLIFIQILRVSIIWIKCHSKQKQKRTKTISWYGPSFDLPTLSFLPVGTSVCNSLSVNTDSDWNVGREVLNLS